MGAESSSSDDLDRFRTDLDRTYLLNEEEDSSGAVPVELEHEFADCAVDLSLYPTERECYPIYRDTNAH